MWQRIQTVWLLLVVLLMGLFSMLDIAVFTLPNGTYASLDNWRFYNAFDGVTAHSVWGIGVLSILSALLALVTIFLYKKRLLQMRLSIFTLLVIIGELGYISWISWRFASLNEAAFAPRFALALPLICLPLLYLASRRIIYDETLVRASNRLR